MENASKALLIAGAILLVIAIIAIGMTIYNQSAKVVTDTGAQIDGMSISTHNAQFDSLDVGETITGRELKTLATKTMSYNKNASKNLKVDFTSATEVAEEWKSSDSTTASGEGWDKIDMSQIKNNEEFEVIGIRYNTKSGIINGIIINIGDAFTDGE